MNFILSREYGKNKFDKAQEEYKKYYTTTNIWNDFLEKTPTLKFLIENNLILYDHIYSSFLKKEALQSSIISEYIVASLYANHLKLNCCNKSEGRAHYFNNNSNINLTYYGNPLKKDLIVKNGQQILKGEIKSHIARAGDCDLEAYNIEGYTHARQGSIFDTPEGKLMIDAFSKKNKDFQLVYDHKNFKIDQDKELCTKISKQYFNDIDFCIVIYPNYIAFFEINENFFKMINYSGSEIRSTGKNYKKIISIDLFKKWAKNNSNIKIEKNIVFMPIDATILIKGRGKTEVTRFGLLNSNCFFIKREDIIDIKDNIIQFPISKIKQCTPNGSIHIAFREV